MMELVFVNQSSLILPHAFVKKWMAAVARRLPARDQRRVKSTQVTVVFLNRPAARKLNREFRDRDYATDVLSFPSVEPQWLGELVICPQVVEKAARAHRLSFKAELGYVLLHGVLHLLGYDHEGPKAQAKKMFALQDRIFEELRGRF